MRDFRLRHVRFTSAFIRLLASLASVASVIAFAPAARADDIPTDADRLANDATRGIGPQPDRVSDSYRRARPVTTDRFEGMLLCEVRVDGEHWDGGDPLGPVRRYMGRVELEARVTLTQRTDTIRYLGPEDTNRVTFAIAGAALNPGDELAIALVDRDVFSDDPIDSYVFSYEGTLPLLATAEHSSLECRGVESSALTARIDAAMVAADAAIVRLETADPPDPSLIGFRDVNADPSAAELAVYEIARYGGLADPRFLARRDRLRAREAQYIDAVAVTVARIVRTATPMLTVSELSGSRVRIRVDKYDCDVDDVLELHPELGLDAPMECALHLTLISTGTESVSHTFHVSDAHGRTLALSRVGQLDDGFRRLRSIRVSRGETHLIFAVPMRRGILLRASRRRSLDWFRLELDAPPAIPATE